ncbi:hypothetical protein GCM10011385_07570 [Nitratireductor aestuarii]|uniref:Divergent polysaccharide deacetylase family protein n=1 Tax=Nitratireductor aestuarii TaxID=1735103 RepID=A0A916RI05_9HYPH|nr:divergent polysaccharide deacetylase family protein [Nitratireductor aestuarii]GGA56552.1 hypothetical protein GCM10011385_07570 [Nitratireductor aestuarii]
MDPFRTELDEPIGKVTPKRALIGRKTKIALLAVVCCAVAGAGITAAFLWQNRFFEEKLSEAVAKVTPPPEQPKPVDATPPKRAPAAPAIIRVNPEQHQGTDPVLIIRDPATLAHNPLTAHLPDPSLLEDSAYGKLPIRDAETGRRPFDAYARPWSGARGARIAIVIGGLGISQTGSQRAIEQLPSEITLAFAPLGNSLDRWVQTARREGHEVMLQVPMEPFDYPRANPGGNVLLVGDKSAGQLDNLHKNLARITSFTGVINHMGARYVSDADAMDTLMTELSARGLGFLDDGTSARSVAKEVALVQRVPFAAADASIDLVPDRAAILAKLDELERIARVQGIAVGIGSSLDVTVDTVTEWSREARKRGIELIPFSAAAFDPEQ